MSKKNRKMKYNNSKVQVRLNSPETEDLDSENSSGSSSHDIGAVGVSLDSRNNDLPDTADELMALRQELTETAKSLEQLRTEYNEIVLKVAGFEQQIRAQEGTLDEVVVDVFDTNKTFYTQNVRNNMLEIQGLLLGAILTDDFKSFEDEIKRKIVEVCEYFDVKFSVEDIDKVYILKPRKIFHRPRLLVNFFSQEVKDMLIAAREKHFTKSKLSGCSDVRRIHIKQFCSCYKILWLEARQVARSKGFQFVWVREGKLFIRKNSKSPKIRITCMKDLDKLEAD